MNELCRECRHDTALHFFEIDYPDYGFCQISTCNCTCEQFKNPKENET